MPNSLNTTTLKYFALPYYLNIRSSCQSSAHEAHLFASSLPHCRAFHPQTTHFSEANRSLRLACGMQSTRARARLHRQFVVAALAFFIELSKVEYGNQAR